MITDYAELSTSIEKSTLVGIGNVLRDLTYKINTNILTKYYVKTKDQGYRYDSKYHYLNLYHRSIYGDVSINSLIPMIP